MYVVYIHICIYMYHIGAGPGPTWAAGGALRFGAALLWGRSAASEPRDDRLNFGGRLLKTMVGGQYTPSIVLSCLVVYCAVLSCSIWYCILFYSSLVYSVILFDILCD